MALAWDLVRWQAYEGLTGAEDPLPVWLPHRAGTLMLAGGRKPRFLSMRASPQACSSDLITRRLASPKMSDPENKEDLRWPLEPSLRSHTVISTLLYWSHRLNAIHFGRGLHKSIKAGVKDHWGPYWTLATTLYMNTSWTLFPYQHLEIELIILNGCIHCMDILYKESSSV